MKEDESRCFSGITESGPGAKGQAFNNEYWLTR
jgi:hypothetical protein